MALKEAIVTVDAEGGDKGKVFVITRMDAISADRWGRHVLQAAIKSGVEIPESEISTGIAGVAALGIRIFGGINPLEADTLLDRLLEQVQIVPDPRTPAVRRKVIAQDFEEIETVGFLHQEAFKIHAGFFKGAGRLFSPLVAALAGALQEQLPPPTSRPSSTRSSRRGSRRSTN